MMAPDDEVNELPILAVLVHRRCYERETGQPAPDRLTLSHHLASRRRSGAA